MLHGSRVTVHLFIFWFMATISAHKPAFCCHRLMVVLIRCSSFVTLWFIIGHLTLLSFLVQFVYFWFIATLSASITSFLVSWTPGSFGTLRFLCNMVLQYRPLNIVVVSAQLVYYWFMTSLSAPKSLLFVAMDFL